MRMADRNLMEKAALLEWFNEDLREGVRQPCYRCVGMAIDQQSQSPHLLLGRPIQIKERLYGWKARKLWWDYFPLRSRRACQSSAVVIRAMSFSGRLMIEVKESVIAVVCLVENLA